MRKKREQLSLLPVPPFEASRIALSCKTNNARDPRQYMQPLRRQPFLLKKTITVGMIITYQRASTVASSLTAKKFCENSERSRNEAFDKRFSIKNVCYRNSARQLCPPAFPCRNGLGLCLTQLAWLCRKASAKLIKSNRFSKRFVDSMHWDMVVNGEFCNFAVQESDCSFFYGRISQKPHTTHFFPCQRMGRCAGFDRT